MSNIHLEIEDPVAVVTLDRPDQLNALTHEMMHELREVFERAAESSEVVGIVVTGTGRGFCAGLDAAALETTATGPQGGRPRATAGLREGDPHGMFTYLLEIEKPIIAAVNGPAAGAGFVLAAAADLRFMAEDAWLRPVFAQRGLAAEHTISWLLTQQLGTGAALDWLWTSRRIDAAEAYRVGFAQRVVAGGELVTEAGAYIRDLAATGSPTSFGLTKRMVYGQATMTMREAAAETNEVTWATVARPDATEGVRSYLERRPPAFARIGRRA
jgi:enoyl-CoA hydratase/carnithine racemase